MDFINRAYGQLADLFKSMSPAARLMAGLLLGVVVVSLGYLFEHRTSGESAYLMGGEPFTAAQLPAMEAAFSKEDLNDYQIEGNRVRVPLGKQSKYMGALASAGALPATFGTYLDKAVNTSPWADRETRRNAIKIAKQNELQNIISHMRGIESAAVMYDVEEARAFGKTNTTTASVSVKPLGDQPLDDNRARMVRYTVASAIAGLKPENITVTDLNGRVYPGSGSDGLGSAVDDRYGLLKKMYEKEWGDKITGALSYIPGVLVISNVELDTETAHEETHTEYDPKTVPYSQRENSVNKLMKSAGPSGRPGPTAQNGVNQPAVVGTSSGAETTDESSHTETQNAVPTKQKHISQQGLTPKRVTVAVSIPSSYYEKIWTERNPSAAGAPAPKPDANGLADIETRVKADVEKTVVALLPSAGASVDPFPRITVTTFQHLPSAPLPLPSAADKALAWVGQYWSVLGMSGLALFSLAMLRSMVRAVPANTAAMSLASQQAKAAPIDEEEDEDEAAPARQTARSRLKRREATGPSLRDELSDMVREDPDAAVSILRNWIGNAS